MSWQGSSTNDVNRKTFGGLCLWTARRRELCPSIWCSTAERKNRELLWSFAKREPWGLSQNISATWQSCLPSSSVTANTHQPQLRGVPTSATSCHRRSYYGDIHIETRYSNILSIYLNTTNTASCFKSKGVLCYLNRSFQEPTQQLPLSPQEWCRMHEKLECCLKTAVFPPFDKPDTPALISHCLYGKTFFPPSDSSDFNLKIGQISVSPPSKLSEHSEL